MKINSINGMPINKANNKQINPSFQHVLNRTVSNGVNDKIASLARKFMPNIKQKAQNVILATSTGAVFLASCTAHPEILEINNVSNTNIVIKESESLAAQIAELKQSVDNNTASEKEDNAQLRTLVIQLITLVLQNKEALENNNKSIGIVIELLKAQGLKMDQIIALLVQSGVDSSTIITLLTEGNAAIAANFQTAIEKLDIISTSVNNLSSEQQEQLKSIYTALSQWQEGDTEAKAKILAAIDALFQEVQGFRGDFNAFFEKQDSVWAKEDKDKKELFAYMKIVSSQLYMTTYQQGILIKNIQEYHNDAMAQSAIANSMRIKILESFDNGVLSINSNMQEIADAFGVKVEDLENSLTQLGVKIDSNAGEIVDAINDNTANIKIRNRLIKQYGRILSMLPQLVQIYGNGIISAIQTLGDKIENMDITVELDPAIYDMLDNIDAGIQAIRKDMNSNHKETLDAINNVNLTNEEKCAKLDTLIAKMDLQIQEEKYQTEYLANIDARTMSIEDLAEHMGMSIDEMKAYLKNLKIDITAGDVDLSKVIDAINELKNKDDSVIALLSSMKDIIENGIDENSENLNELIDLTKDGNKILADSYTVQTFIKVTVEALLEKVSQFPDLSEIKPMLQEILNKLGDLSLEEILKLLEKILNKIPEGCECDASGIIAKLEIIIKNIQKDESIITDELDDMFAQNDNKTNMLTLLAMGSDLRNGNNIDWSKNKNKTQQRIQDLNYIAYQASRGNMITYPMSKSAVAEADIDTFKNRNTIAISPIEIANVYAKNAESLT